ncbi:uncharacterized protein JCM15063_006196 [Sporobolomyces koalae]|uniref:uncharacterized protein n=1 Tax=Sporobolomyces koalae TaxID=500713 RepID=UPI00317E637C
MHEQGELGLTGLGIRILDCSSEYLSCAPQPRSPTDDVSSIASTPTTAELDLTPIVDAFPAPPLPLPVSPEPSRTRSPPSRHPYAQSASPSAEADSPEVFLQFDCHPQLQHRPSISTIASDLTHASTNSSVPSPRTPTVVDDAPIGVVVPRPNAAKLRRARSFAKPVSILFSPDRPPALPLPSLPPPSTVVASMPSQLTVPSSEPSQTSTIPFADVPVLSPATSMITYGFYTPSYGRVSRRPPSAPPDRPLPGLPPAAERAPRDSRLALLDGSSIPFDSRARAPVVTLALSPLSGQEVVNDSSRPRTCSDTSDASTPTMIQPNPATGERAQSDLSFEGYSMQVPPRARIRTRVDSTSSVASLDMQKISHQLDELAQGKSPVPPEEDNPSKLAPAEIGQTDREKDRERVRKLISRVSSVIEMRKLSTASCATTASAESAPAEKNGYKAYKLARKPSMSPSTSFSRHAGRSPRSRRESTSSFSDRSDDDGEYSSESEEMFDLSFDSSYLSPPSSLASSVTSDGIGTRAYVRESCIPGRWAGRRNSSTTTIDEEESPAFEANLESPTTDLKSRVSYASLSTQPPINRHLPATNGRSLRSVSSLPVLRTPTSSPRLSYTVSPASYEPRTPSSARLKPLLTSSPPHVRKSLMPPASTTRIPMTGLARRTSYSPSYLQSPNDPFRVAPLRKTSLPVSSSTSSGAQPAQRKSAAQLDAHRRKSSLANLSYHHSTNSRTSTLDLPAPKPLSHLTRQ